MDGTQGERAAMSTMSTGTSDILPREGAESDLPEDVPSRPSRLSTEPHPYVPRLPRWHDYTAFVLSGGGARGALQAGALRALFEVGEYPDILIGTSAGALNGAVLAQNPSLAGLDRLDDAWRAATPGRVLLGHDFPTGTRPQAITGILLFAAGRRLMRGFSSLYSDSGVRQLLAEFVPVERFEDLRLPLHVIATDLTHGRRAIFATGPLHAAILASAAIPGVFPPVSIDGIVHVDGGALDNYSVDTAVRLGARRVFILDVGYDSSEEEENAELSLHGVAEVLERTTQTMSRYHLERAIRRVPRGIELHVLRLASKNVPSALAFGHADELIAQGYEEARAYVGAHLPAPLARQQDVAPIAFDSAAPPVTVPTTAHTSEA